MICLNRDEWKEGRVVEIYVSFGTLVFQHNTLWISCEVCITNCCGLLPKLTTPLQESGHVCREPTRVST